MTPSTYANQKPNHHPKNPLYSKQPLLSLSEPHPLLAGQTERNAPYDSRRFQISPFPTAMADAPSAENDDQETGSPNGEIAVAADLPAHNRRSTPSSAGGGREDCWSEGATAVLIEAWGERFVGLSRGSLKQKHWEEVAEIVAARAAEGKTPKTHVQCKYRIDTVKKKYKSEKAKLAAAAGDQPSNWPFFDRVDQLLGSPNAFPSAAKKSAVVAGSGEDIPAGIPVGRSVHRHQPPPASKQPNPTLLRRRKRPVPVDSGSDTEDISPESSDSLLPANPDGQRGRKRQRTELDSPPPRPRRFEGTGGRPAAGGRVVGDGKSVRELTKAILKFGEAYEKTERVKLQQMVEMEMQRMKFAKEIELQRMKFLVKTQMELSQISRVGGRLRGAGGGGGGDSNHRLINGADETNVNNISNSSD